MKNGEETKPHRRKLARILFWAVLAAILVLVVLIGRDWCARRQLAAHSPSLGALRSDGLRLAQRLENLRQQEQQAKVSAAPSPPRTGASGLHGYALYQAVRRDPKFAEFRRIEGRRIIQERYRFLFAELGLPPDKSIQFEGLLLERQDALSYPEEARRARNEVTADMHQLLGEEGYRTYQTYEQSIAFRTEELDELQGTLAYDGTPALEPGQIKSLLDLFVQTYRSQGPGRPAMYGTNGALWPQFPELAATVLSPAQLSTYLEMRDRLSQQRALRSAILGK